MKLPAHKSKIVCTIGPASSSDAVPEQLFEQGMNVARLNLAHGTLEGHKEDIRRTRAVAAPFPKHPFQKGGAKNDQQENDPGGYQRVWSNRSNGFQAITSEGRVSGDRNQ
ncbi:pyruvate kinase [Desulfosarcina sp.]|uniref:pyruvate kinase n=1 Tax=Desulfosarcina sp. TaxID=2027861 RepID=UPI00397078B6